MKVYIIKADNGESYGDYYSWIEKVFTTYKDASQWLVDEGYEPYLEHGFNSEVELKFHWQESDGYVIDYSNAMIIEMEVNE